MNNSRTLKPPSHLSAAAKRWFADVVAEFELDASALKLLTMAAETWDRYEQARKALQQHGLTYEKDDAIRPRPEVAIERDCRLAFARLLRELNLDVAPPETRIPRGGRYATRH